MHVKLKCTGNPFSVLGKTLVDVKKATFGTRLLQTTDLNAAPTKSVPLTITNTPMVGWCSKSLLPAQFTYFNRNGLTQFRLRFAKDDDNDSIADFLRFCSGNHLTKSYRPVLVVQFYGP